VEITYGGGSDGQEEYGEVSENLETFALLDGEAGF
jgi:hypothetical protein